MSDKYVEIDKSVVMLLPEIDSNMSCIELDNGLVFVDAGSREEAAAKFREDMEKKFGKKTQALFLTHYHQDHYCGMAAFKDVEIIAAKENSEHFITELKGSLTKANRKARIDGHKQLVKERKIEPTANVKLFWETYSKSDLFPPTQTVETKLEYGEGEKKIIFKVTGGHSTCSSLVYIPFAKTLIIGDNLASDPARVGGCFFAGINDTTLNVLEKTEKLDVETIIPGHGPKTDPKYLTTARKYFVGLFKLFKEMIKEGKTAEEAIKDPRIPEFYDKPHERWEDILKRQFDRVELEHSKKIIKKTFTKFIEAYNQNKIDEVLKFYTKNFSVLFPGGFSVTGPEMFRQRTITDLKVLKNDHEPQEQYILGEKYVEKGKHFFNYEANGIPVSQEREYMHVWEKEDGSWKIGLNIVLSEKDLK